MLVLIIVIEKQEEIWLPIKGYEGYYEVSNKGQLRSISRLVNAKLNSKRKVISRIRKLSVSGHGYYKVNLSIGDKRISELIHRLVAITWISNPKNKPLINHVDGNKLNNNIDNLEWCTASENTQHSWDIGIKRAAKLKQEQVLQIRNNYQGNYKKGAEYYGMAYNTYKSIILGKTYKDI